MIQDGKNTVTLAALDGDNDVSLVQSIQLNYGHTYIADADWLSATAQCRVRHPHGRILNSQIDVFDITDPLAIARLKAPVTSDGSSYGVR